MADYNDIVKIAVDGMKGRVQEYSTAQSQELLRKALVEANGGKTTLDYRAIRDGKCNGLFTLLEEILDRTVIEGLQEDDYFMSLVDFRNVAEGDSPVFIVEDSNLFVVADTADGTQGVRRQRLAGESEVTIQTTMKTVRIYEELNRVLSGRVDFNDMITKVSESIQQRILNDVYTLWTNIVADDIGGTVYYPAAGSFDEDTLLDLIAHVEAASNGQTATIIGTKKALRNIKESIDSDAYKDEVHNLGYIGTFYGTPVVALPQRHKINSTEFVFEDDFIVIIAGSSTPIKFVYEGDPLVIMGDPTDNADLTQEYFYGVKYGLGLVTAGQNTGIGRYDFA